MARGLVKYFFHSPLSELPIRDVSNALDFGYKTEPHIEIGSENYLKPCYQSKIRKFSEEGNILDYLFWVTKCKNRQMKQFDKQFIVGYMGNIHAQEKTIYNRSKKTDQQVVSIRGNIHFVSFDDAVLVADIFDWKSFARGTLTSREKSITDKEKTKQLLEMLVSKENIVDNCIEEIIRLDKDKNTCIPDHCDLKEQCPRYIIQ